MNANASPGFLAAGPGVSLNWLRALARRVTWRVPAGALGLGILFNGLRVLEISGADARPDNVYVATAVMQTVAALFVILATLAADEAVERGVRRAIAYPIAVITGCALAAFAQVHVRSWFDLRLETDVIDLPPEVLSLQPLVVFFELSIWAAIGVSLYVSHRGARRAAATRHATEVQRAFAQRRVFETRLCVLQARVEPGFLLDVLGHVRELSRSDLVAGERMLDALIDYLRAALPTLRDAVLTLGRELELLASYLALLRMRMRGGLAVQMDVPDALRRARMPPMVLLPLVAALVRRLAQMPERRSLTIDVRQDDGRIAIRVVVYGIEESLLAEPESLRPLQERLGALHGEAASIVLERAGQNRCQAVIYVPNEATEGHSR